MKVLIVVDMQNDFIDGALGTPEACRIVESVKEKIKSFEGTVIFTRDTHYSDYLNTQEGRNLPVKHCIRGTEGWEIRPELEQIRKEKGMPVYDKPGFGSRELAEELARVHLADPIEEVELCGLCTDICVIVNALVIKAFLPEVPLCVDASCCAGVTPESHANALAAMRMCQISIKGE